MNQSLESAALEIGIDAREIDLHCIGVEQRFPTLAKPHKRNGGATVNPSGSVCLHNWETDERVTWRPHSVRRELSDEERHTRATTLRRDTEARERHQRQQWADAAEVARLTWRKAKPARADHPYLVRKKLCPFDLGEVDVVNGQRDRWLIAPAYDRDMHVRNLECINESGEKRPIRGAQRKGLFGLVGPGMPTSEIIIAEGWATSAALAVSLNACVVAAYGAGNLLLTVQLWRSMLRYASITIAADHDLNQAGQSGAIMAAQAVALAGDDPAEVTIKMPAEPGDWCDVFVELGAAGVVRAWHRG